MIKITGLWANKDKNGNTYYSGYVGNLKVMVFKNAYKEDNENAPDANLYIAEKQKDPQAKDNQNYKPEDLQ